MLTLQTRTDEETGRRSEIAVSVDLAAHLLSVSRRTVYNRIRDGKLETIRTERGSRQVLVDSLCQMGFTPQVFPSSASSVSFIYRPSRY